jgi:hypothetical protein
MKANQAGRYAEDVVAAALHEAGCAFERQLVIGRTIYGTDYRADFVVRNLFEYPQGLVLESKWQSTGGSVDEKFPYLLENIRHACPFPAMVIVHGQGCRAGALEWLRARCCREHLVAVFTLEELMIWLQRRFTIPLAR